MQKRGELSRLTVNLLIGFLILCLAVIIFIIVRGYVNEQDKYEVYTDEKIDLKISQVKKVDDNTLDLTLKRNAGEGNFIGLSFSVTDGNKVEVVRIDSSMPENETGNFSLKFIELNASNIKKISVTPIYLDKEGEEVIGNVKDEYVAPNVCSTYCPPNAQCGTNGCGAPCGNECAKGYSCLDYKCVKDKTSSSGGSDSDDGCKDTCLSLGYKCGTHTICGEKRNCGTCLEGYTCQTNGTCTRDCVPATCQSLGNPCGTVSDGCGKTLNCINCSEGYTCQTNGTCTLKPCTDTCESLGYVCGNMSVCGELKYCGDCSTGYTCQENGTCLKNCVPETDAQFCSRLNKQCGSVTANDNCGVSRIVSNCGSCDDSDVCTIDECNAAGLCTHTPISCDDNNPCTSDTCNSQAGCVHIPVTSGTLCGTGDACNLFMCNARGVCEKITTLGCCLNNAQCGSGTACPQDYCNLTDNKCYQNYPACKHNDRCCPPGCNLGNDNDCTRCTSNAQCEDNDPCTTNFCSNNACTFPKITTCNSNDGCCPLGCNANNDNDCSASCGNGVIESGEQCDGSALGGATCASVLGTGHVGTLSCVSPPNGCLFDTSKCCKPETDAQFCSRLNRVCGNLTANDNCGNRRTVSSCGTCQSPLTCQSGQCVCTPETDAQFCSRLNRVCGNLTANDNCGNRRTVSSCGTCPSGQSCATNGTCIRDAPICVPTTCSALGRNCGTVSDGCGGTLTCGNYGGGCQSGYSCANNGTCIKDDGTMKYLVQNKVGNADIVVASNAPNTVKLASKYFQMYIYNMTGVTLPISSSPSTSKQYHVYIGKSTYTDNLGINSLGCVNDGFKIVSGDNYLVLIGDDEPFQFTGPTTYSAWDALTGGKWENTFIDYYHKQRSPQKDIWKMDGMGSLNAVYEFLYDQGIRWYYPGDIGIIIPEKSNIGYKNINLLKNPDYPFRGIAMSYLELGHIIPSLYPNHEVILQWVLSLRLNNYFEFMSNPAHGTEDVIFRENTKREHPEYYAILNGVRMNGNDPVPDLCSPELLAENVRYAKAMFDLYNFSIVSVMPTDGFQGPSASSAACLAKRDNSRGWESALSNYVWDYVNNVAWEIYNDPKYAGKKISCCSYPPYLYPPTNLSKPVAPNLIVGLTQWRSWFNDKESDRIYKEVRNEWINFLPSKEVFSYDYYLYNREGTKTQNLPAYFPQLIVSDLRSLKENSIGEFMEVYSNWPEWHLTWDSFAATSFNVYVTSRVYWDVNLDIDALLNEYYELYYGPAKNEMKAFVEFSEANYIFATGLGPQNSSVIPTMKSMLNNAKSVAGNTIYGQRIDLLIGLINSK